MSETKEIKLTGWNAVGALLVIGVFLLFKLMSASSSMESEGVGVIKEYLQSEYVRYHMEEKQGLDNLTSHLLNKDAVSLKSVNMRGNRLKPIVKAELTPSSSHPKNMPTTYYFYMEYSALTGWIIRYEATAFSYNTTLF
jgi:hypothetical protein